MKTLISSLKGYEQLQQHNLITHLHSSLVAQQEHSTYWIRISTRYNSFAYIRSHHRDIRSKYFNNISFKISISIIDKFKIHST